MSAIETSLGIEPRPATHSQSPEARPLEITCSLIPVSQLVTFIIFLLVLSSLSWLTGAPGPLSWISTALQFVLIPVVVFAAARLKLIVSPSGIQAKSRLHKQMLYPRVQRAWTDLHAVRIRKLKNPLAILQMLNAYKNSRLTPPSLPARALSFFGKDWGQQGFLVMDFRSVGMSSVYLAHNRSGERIVVKELSLPQRTAVSNLAEIHEMFAREFHGANQKITFNDFGAANEFVSSMTGTMMGKQCYIPPEQFRGQAVPQSDLYALGGTLHFLLTGEDPEPITPSHPAKVRAEVSSTMDQLVAKLTASEPEERIQSAQELLSVLQTLTRVSPLPGRTNHD